MDEQRHAVLRGFLRIGVFIGVGGLILALIEPRESGEFVVSVCSALIGGLLMLGAAVMLRLSRRE